MLKRQLKYKREELAARNFLQRHIGPLEEAVEYGLGVQRQYLECALCLCLSFLSNPQLDMGRPALTIVLCADITEIVDEDEIIARCENFDMGFLPAHLVDYFNAVTCILKLRQRKWDVIRQMRMSRQRGAGS